MAPNGPWWALVWCLRCLRSPVIGVVPCKFPSPSGPPREPSNAFDTFHKDEAAIRVGSHQTLIHQFTSCPALSVTPPRGGFCSRPTLRLLWLPLDTVTIGLAQASLHHRPPLLFFSSLISSPRLPAPECFLLPCHEHSRSKRKVQGQSSRVELQVHRLLLTRVMPALNMPANPPQEYWLPGYGLSRHIVFKELQCFLGPNATVRPYSYHV